MDEISSIELMRSPFTLISPSTLSEPMLRMFNVFNSVVLPLPLAPNIANISVGLAIPVTEIHMKKYCFHLFYAVAKKISCFLKKI